MNDYISREQAIEALNAEINFSIESDIDFSLYKKELQEFANNILLAQEKAIRALPPKDITISGLIEKMNIFGADEYEYKFDAEKDGQKYQFSIKVERVEEVEDE